MREDRAAPVDWHELRPQLEADAPDWQDDKFRVPRILEEVQA
jgi:Asp-tRNA(Asn)/Glu-tRNA(Gln) amidotransferase C subunit